MKTGKKAVNLLGGILLFLVLVAVDQITKRLAVLHLKNQPPIIWIKDVFQLSYLENRGAAFGIMQGGRPVFILITVVILGVILYCYFRAPLTRKFLAFRSVLVLIAAGALGNCIDRARQGYVVDFFYFNLIDFPVFNVADIYVTCAAVWLAILVLFLYKEPDLSELLKSLGLSRKKG